MSRSWENGSSRAWRALRLRVLARDGWRCQIGMAGICLGRASCVHHVRGRARTGDDPAHLVAACQPCNLKIGDPTRQADPPSQPKTRWK